MSKTMNSYFTNFYMLYTNAWNLKKVRDRVQQIAYWKNLIRDEMNFRNSVEKFELKLMIVEKFCLSAVIANAKQLSSR